MLSQLQVELTNSCNCKCLFCSNRCSNRLIRDMDLNLLDKIVHEMVELGLPIGVCGIGEPTIHPEFSSAIEILGKTSFSLGTNAVNFTEDKIDAVIKYKFVDIVFSPDAATAETFFKMKQSTDFDKAKENIHLFLDKIKKEKKFWRNIYIQFVYNELNKNEVQQFIDYWLDYWVEGVIIYIKSLCPSPITEANSLYPPPSNDLSNLRQEKKVQIDQLDKPIRFSNCELFKSFAMIMSDGAYSPCCMNTKDVYKIGNINTMTIMECYESDKMQKYIRLQANRKYKEIPFCKSCWI